MQELIEELKKAGVLKTPEIIAAFEVVQRSDFVPNEMLGFASVDTALPIGYEQTISQPYVVAFMLEHLTPGAGDRILDIGSGSGWTTALLAHIVGEQGRVIAIEVIPELAATGKVNVEKCASIDSKVVTVLNQNGEKGYEKEAPYDKILVSASLPQKEIPSAWKKQLKVGGKIVAPIQESIWIFEKKTDVDFKEKEYPGFVFVPFQKN